LNIPTPKRFRRLGFDPVARTPPPVIQINGDNPAHIHVGDTYSDLGATILAPQAELNLGIHTLVGSTAMDQAVIDTSAPATYHINYVVTDQNGLTATSTRTVVIQSNPSSADATTPAASPTAGTATTTTATTTAQ
jgi:hypothetical protein